MTLPSLLPEVSGEPELKRFLQRHVDMQIAEVRKMFVREGFNFPLSSYMLDLISGMSVCFYNASTAGVLNTSGRGQRFKGCLLFAYPIESDLSISRSKLVDILWDYARNPLSHALGVYLPRQSSPNEDVALTKRRISNIRLASLEDSITRPMFCLPTVTVARGTGKTMYDLHLSTLYWGIHRMLHTLLQDHSQIQASATLASAINSFMDIT
jgi:hypothetical protein